VLGALTTSLLIFLPNPVAEGFEAQALLYTNSMHIAKLWILFLHPQVNAIAVLGLGLLLVRRTPVLVIPGTLFILIWAVAEMAQQAYMIDAVNQIWRPAFQEATDEVSRQALYAQLLGANAIRDSLYFLVIYGFGMGTFLLGFAMYAEDRLARGIGLAFILIGVLSLSSFGRYFLGLSFLTPPVDWIYDFVYPWLQPAVRIALGFWLWRQAASQPD
jgi:hypothetical protein